MLAGMAWSMCSSTWKSCSRGPAPERSLLPSPPSPHHPGRDARGSANTNHEDIPSLELADRALVDACAAESSAYESTFSRAVERAVDERHERPLVERDGRGAGALVAARESRGITSPFYRGRGERRRWQRVAPSLSSRGVRPRRRRFRRRTGSASDRTSAGGKGAQLAITRLLESTLLRHNV